MATECLDYFDTIQKKAYVDRGFSISFCIYSRFYDECKRRYTIKLWKTFTDCFNCLPVAAIGMHFTLFMLFILEMIPFFLFFFFFFSSAFNLFVLLSLSYGQMTQIKLNDDSIETVDEKIFTCHGGLSPDLASMEQIRRIMRPTDVPDQGLLCDLLWSDPDKDTMGWGENDRGVSFTFGAEVSNVN